MRLTANAHTFFSKVNDNKAFDIYQKTKEHLWLPEDDELLELIPEQEEDDFQASNLYEAQREEEVTNSGEADLEDNSRKLTRLLVAAKSQFVVQLVLGEAHKDMVNLRMAAISGDKELIAKANAIIRRLEKLIRRGNRKITDLGTEDRIRRDMEKAEADAKVERAKQIAADLKRKLAERKTREKRYLEDRDEDDDELQGGLENAGVVNPATKLSAAEEAKIEAMARALAAAEASAGSNNGGDFADVSSEAMPSPNMSGEGAAMGGEGAEVSGGGIDIAV